MMDIHSLFYKEGYTHIYIYRVQKNSMPKIREVIGETKRKIYCRATLCMLDVHPCSAMDHQHGLTKVGNLAKPLNYSEK